MDASKVGSMPDPTGREGDPRRGSMRATVTLLVAVLALLLMPVGAAARQQAGCPNDDSGYMLVDLQTWWDITVDGFEAAGIPVYVGGDPANGFTEEFDAFGAAFGLGDGQGVYDFIWGPQWDKIDKGGDGWACMKPRPVTPGNPAYFFNGVDNTSNAG
jgi:hypothetical protein